MTFQLLRRRLAAAVVVCAIAPAALAQSTPSYPTKPIRFVVGFTAGSATDVIARIVAEHVGKKLGQPVVVDNKTGANGMLAAGDVAASAPDGYTVLISNVSTITINPQLYKKVSYDVQRDFAPVSLMVSFPFVLTVSGERKKPGSVGTLKDLIALARDNPGKVSYGSAGQGNLMHLSFERLNSMAGVTMLHVPYRGTPQAQTAVMAEEVDAVLGPASLPLIRSGKLKALAVSSAQRWSELPDVPSVAELGYPDYDISAWTAALVPSRTPPAVIKVLYEAIHSAAADPATRAQLSQQGAVLMLNPQQFASRIDQETQIYGEIIRKSNIQLD